LLNKILAHLDKEAFENIRQTKERDQIIFEVTNTLRILNYPIPPPPQDVNWQNGLFSAERRIVYPVIYYLLTRLSDLEKRAYLARFLVPFTIPDEIPMDEELKTFLNQYKDL
jgi:intraflagellar transport protein 81